MIEILESRDATQEEIEELKETAKEQETDWREAVLRTGLAGH